MAAFQNALTRKGFPPEARAILIDPNRENINMVTLAGFNDDDAEALCASLRKPGGVLAGAPNPGVYVPARAEANLKMACYMARDLERTQRAVDPAFISQGRLRLWRTYKEAEENTDEPSDPPKLSKPKKDLGLY